MNEKNRQTLFLIVFGILLFAVVMNFSVVLTFLRRIADLLFPILLGLLFAFVLNVPMTGFEKLLTRLSARAKHEPSIRLLHGMSLMLTLLCIALVIFLAFALVLPELAESAKSVWPLLKEQWPVWTEQLKACRIDLSAISGWAAKLDMKTLAGGADNVMGSAMQAAASTVSGVANTVFGLVISIYILISKSTLGPQVRKLIGANLKKSTAERICSIASLIRETYSKFLSGQCVEAILLGCLIVLAFSLFRLPYAGLTGFLTSLFAFVPYVGAFASCFIGALLTLLAAPSKVLLCVLVYLAVQFIENQFIYPHVVGNSVGLSPLWTLIAALLGGKMFGLPGIIFFIPLVAVIYSLVRENTNRKLKKQAAAGGSAGIKGVSDQKG